MVEVKSSGPPHVWTVVGVSKGMLPVNISAQTNPLFASVLFFEDCITVTTLRSICPSSGSGDISWFKTVVSVCHLLYLCCYLCYLYRLLFIVVIYIINVIYCIIVANYIPLHYLVYYFAHVYYLCHLLYYCCFLYYLCHLLYYCSHLCYLCHLL